MPNAGDWDTLVKDTVREEFLEGVVYSTRVLDPATGKEIEIMEIWIEKLKIGINEINGAFSSYTPRNAINHFGTFPLPDGFCVLVKDYVAKKTSFELGNAKLFSLLKSRLIHKKSQHNRIV